MRSTAEAIASNAGGSEAVRQSVRTDERLELLVTEALDAGARTTLEGKRQLLGRAVGRALGGDSARVDWAQIMTVVVLDIEAPHIMALERIRHAETKEGDPEDKITPVEKVVEGELAPVISTLQRHGLLVMETLVDRGPVVTGVSDFGRELLTELRQTAGDLPTASRER